MNVVIRVLETIWAYWETRLCPPNGELSDALEPESAREEHIFASAKNVME